MKFYVYLHQEEREYGPYSAEEIIEMIYEGTVEWTDGIREPESTTWLQMKDVFDLEELQSA